MSPAFTSALSLRALSKLQGRTTEPEGAEALLGWVGSRGQTQGLPRSLGLEGTPVRSELLSRSCPEAAAQGVLTEPQEGLSAAAPPGRGQSP